MECNIGLRTTGLSNDVPDKNCELCKSAQSHVKPSIPLPTQIQIKLHTCPNIVCMYIYWLSYKITDSVYMLSSDSYRQYTCTDVQVLHVAPTHLLAGVGVHIVLFQKADWFGMTSFHLKAKTEAMQCTVF